jgi:hypothetical protein
MALGFIDLDFREALEKGIGKISGLKFFPTLKDTDLLACPRQAGRGNATPISRAHDDDRVMGFNVLNG